MHSGCNRMHSGASARRGQKGEVAGTLPAANRALFHSRAGRIAAHLVVPPPRHRAGAGRPATLRDRSCNRMHPGCKGLALSGGEAGP
eukprot:scaffold110786_cov30-Phaeocystis_antarctica.AAC.1